MELLMTTLVFSYSARGDDLISVATSLMAVVGQMSFMVTLVGFLVSKMAPRIINCYSLQL